MAGPTTCRFGEVRRAGGAWVTAAACRNAGRRWTSQVRLTVESNRLTWTSERGATSYLRWCGPALSRLPEPAPPPPHSPWTRHRLRREEDGMILTACEGRFWQYEVAEHEDATPF